MAVSNNWKNLRSFLRKTYNREVNEWFRDVPNNVPDNSTARRQAKRASLILPNDSQNIALIKSLSFRYNVQRIQTWSTSYGMPIDEYQQKVTFRPIVHLFFRQDLGAVPDGRRPIRGQVAFRLINETSATMTENKARSLAVRIRSEFANNDGYVWKKGKNKYTYKHLDEGANFSVLSISETEGKEVIQKVLDVMGLTYIEDFFQEILPKKDSVTSPTGTRLVYEEQRREKRWRPTGNVRFRYATLTIHGMNHRIVLVDRSNRYWNAYELV